MISRYIEEVLSRYPKSTGAANQINCEIVTSTEKSEGTWYSFKQCIYEKLEETHIRQIKEVIEEFKDKQCYVRIMPEHTREGLAEMYYTRLQFENRS